jgi:copper homeostasis protein
MQIEVVATTAQGCIDAERNGADRIELCMDLSCGGVTPSVGLLKAVLKAVKIPVFVLIRAREGDFVYSQLEKEIMLDDIRTCVQLGAHGIVAGALTPTFEIDVPFLNDAKQATGHLPFTFHRAFDETIEPFEAARILFKAKVDRILTSGQAKIGPDGHYLIRKLMHQTECPQLLGGSGITPENVLPLLELGIPEIHFGARKWNSGHIGKGLFDPGYNEVDEAIVRQMRNLVDSFTS